MTGPRLRRGLDLSSEGIAVSFWLSPKMSSESYIYGVFYVYT